jgi:hypothetical protein
MAQTNKVPSTTETMTMSKGDEVAMRNRKAFLSLAVLAAVGLLVATAARAADPVPPQSCTTSNGWSITATSFTVGPCNSSGTGTGQCTEVLYNINAGPTATPDHVATFVRGEVTITDTFPVTTISPPCDGDSVIGMPSNVDCHEALIRWNNQQTKANQFGVEGQGSRAPITTSVVVRKGNSVGSCPIVGLGLEGTNPLATVNTDVDEVVGGKCKVHTHTVAGVTTVKATPVDPNAGYTCDVTQIPLSQVNLSVSSSTGQSFTGPVEYSEGVSAVIGSGSCSLKQYYPPTAPYTLICW